MTFIQPTKQLNIWNGVVIALVILMVGATFTLVAVYNGIVNAQHNIASLKSELDAQGAANTNLENQIIATLGGGAASQVAQNDGLIEDNNPEYLPTASAQSLSLQ